MSQYGGGPRFTRAGPRFNTPPLQRHLPRHYPHDNRSPLNRPIHAQTTNEPQRSTPSTTDSSAVVRNPPPPPPSLPATTNPSLNTSDTKPIDAMTVSNPSFELVDNKSSIKTESNSSEHSQYSTDPSGQKRSRSDFDSSIISSESSNQQQQHQISERRTTQGGRCRLFIGNIPSDLTKEDFQKLFSNYGELVEYFVNPSRGFGFIKLSSRQIAEQAKYDLDGYVLRGKPLRVRFASQGATIKVKNLSNNVSNELLKEAFEQYFGPIERAVIIVDDRGKSTGEGIIEFEKKPSAQKCLNECTERCFFVSSELRPVIVEPWDIKDEEDGLPEKSLIRNAAYTKERELKPRFAELNTIEQTIGLKWKELELQEKQLLEEVKRRMQYATEQMQIEIDQMYLEHQSQVLREELTRRQEELRRIDELRSQEFERRRQIYPFHLNSSGQSSFPLPPNSRSNFDEYQSSTHFDRKRSRY